MIIDLSHHNTITDWNKVKSAVEGVILRMGYTGYGSGKCVYDKKYKDYLREVKALNMLYGLYYFPQSITVDEAVKEAEFIYNEVKDQQLLLGLWLDSEHAEPVNKSGRADKLTRADRTTFLHIIIEYLKERGIPCGVYASTSWLYNNLDMNMLKDVPVWVAQWKAQCEYKGNYILWQYSNKGIIPGIVGSVDLNVLHSGPVQTEDQELDNAITVIAKRVIAGRFGEGHERRKENIYSLIRKKVNDII